MAITLIHYTGDMQQILNAKKIGKVKNKEEVEIPLPSDPVMLQVTQYGGSHSKILEVKEGESIQITIYRWNYTTYIYFISFPF